MELTFACMDDSDTIVVMADGETVVTRQDGVWRSKEPGWAVGQAPMFIPKGLKGESGELQTGFRFVTPDGEEVDNVVLYIDGDGNPHAVKVTGTGVMGSA